MTPSARPSWPIVLGIDPGTRVAGFGALVAAPDRIRLHSCGVIRMPAKASIGVRLAQLARELDEILADLRPTMVAIESAFTARNVRSALRIGESRGVALASAARWTSEIVEIPPAVAKKSVCGNGAASKEQVHAMVEAQLGLQDLDVADDATDALALALACLLRARSPFVRAVAKARPS